MNEQATEYKPKINFSDIGTVFRVERKSFESGRSVTNLTVTLYEGKNKDGTYKPSTFLEIQCWGEVGDYAMQLQPKHRVKVDGKLTSRQYTDKTGAKRTQYFVNASHLEYVESTYTQ